MKCGCIVLENPVPCKQFEYSYFKGYEKQSMISLPRHLSAIKQFNVTRMAVMVLKASTDRRTRLRLKNSSEEIRLKL